MTVLTLESRDYDYADRATQSLVKRMPSGAVLRVE